MDMGMVDKNVIIKKVNTYTTLHNLDDDFKNRFAEMIINDCIPELEQNLMEWAEDKPFTDIVVGNGWTVNKILDIYPWVDFPEILTALKHYKEDEYKDETFTINFHIY